MPESSPPTSVRDLKAAEGGSGRPFSALLILRKISTKTATNGKPYLTVDLGDRTGSFSCTIFSDGPAFEAMRTAETGAVFRVEGKTETYQGRFSPKLTRAAAVPPEELTAPDVIESLVETAPEDATELWRDFNGFAQSIAQPELRATVQFVMDEIGDGFRTAPAAVTMHHAYRHGLLEHTVHMARDAKVLLPLYPEVDADLAMAGILLHDTGKTVEYEGTLATRKSRRGILQGHVVLGYQLVRKAAIKAKLDFERAERLEHIILSHQGLLEWGAAAVAATPEAVFVSMIDNLDAKMGMVQRALRTTPAGDDFSERILGLDAPLLIKRLPP
jgi:3'-5' exoribonuclease